MKLVMDHSRTPNIRRDGWTPERQLRFLGALARCAPTRARRVAAIAAFRGPPLARYGVNFVNFGHHDTRVRPMAAVTWLTLDGPSEPPTSAS
jgi:hypothetical protein